MGSIQHKPWLNQVSKRENSSKQYANSPNRDISYTHKWVFTTHYSRSGQD